MKTFPVPDTSDWYYQYHTAVSVIGYAAAALRRSFPLPDRVIVTLVGGVVAVIWVRSILRRNDGRGHMD